MDINPTALKLVLISAGSLVAALALIAAAIALWSIKLALFGAEAASLCPITFWAAHYIATHQAVSNG